MRTLLLLLGLLGITTTTLAEQSVSQGEFVVHYAAIKAGTLTPEIAARYGVKQRSGEGLLVLNAQRQSGGPAQAVGATASGSVRDLIGEAQPLRFRTVTEDGIETLVAPFRFADLQVLKFELQVLPTAAPAPLAIRFSQQFFRD